MVLELPNKKYNIIYADPPWSYKDKALAGNRGACCKYDTQSKDWIENLQVKSITADECVLFMWVTMPKLNECFDVIKSWGFEYKTVAFTWIKKNKIADSLFWGMVTDYTEEDIFISCDTVEGQYIEYEAAMCQYCSITIEIGYRTK